MLNNPHHRLLLTLLAIVFFAGLTASRIQTDGGRVVINDIKIPTQNGQWVAGDLFKPRSASHENPAPLIVVVPGFQRSREALANIAIELARRGIVVISIDPYAQGRSSTSTSRRAATTEGYGMFAVVDYAAGTGNLNYIDKKRIAATGHSAGGNAAIRGGNYFGREAQLSGEPSKLHSVFVSGYVLTLTADVLRDVRSNIGVSYAFYDEGAYRNELKNGDMRTAPEALRVVNHGRKQGLPPVTEVELGHYYGELADRSLRVIHNERILHPFQPYMPEATANQIEFFERVFGLDSDLTSDDQIWYWKELLGAISLIAAMVSLIPLSRILLQTPYFQSLVRPLPPPLPRPAGPGRWLFWGLFVLSALVACFSYIPMAELSQQLFTDASSRQMTWFFPQRMNNAVMLWALLNGSLGYLLFFLSYRFFGRTHGVEPEMWGAKIGRQMLFRTFLLALTLFFYYFLLVFLVYFLFHVDYNFLFMGVRVFRPELLILLCMYAPFFFVFFLSNSLRVNAAMRFEGDPEWKSMLLSGVANSLGLFLIVLIQYITFAVTGMVYWTDGWLYVNLLFAVVPMMFVLPYFNRYFFRVTGTIYLGPMVTCLIFIMVLISNTVFYLPL
ncbi:MAG: alpha/beta hydrolase [Xanthomonadales bacterium]|nr:alpha/beta hydrolase [Gammaproteobacteria bacterium]MBT8053602.1 alpha/beta hydrolase [Gammaproteobacteria bacterium]NND58620.1 alpha/beta hydrolase [Xanthomonadales bacterium]NNK50990.1 alpha/beta hydrolase [Xanthomonadales bacterium]